MVSLMSIDHVIEPCLWPARPPACVCVRVHAWWNLSLLSTLVFVERHQNQSLTLKPNRTMQCSGANNILLEEDLFCWQSFDGASVGPMRHMAFVAALWSVLRAWASQRAVLKSDSDRMNKIAFYSHSWRANETIVRQLAAPFVPGGHRLFVCHPGWRIIGGGGSNRPTTSRPHHPAQASIFHFISSFVPSSSFANIIVDPTADVRARCQHRLVARLRSHDSTETCHDGSSD